MAKYSYISLLELLSRTVPGGLNRLSQASHSLYVLDRFASSAEAVQHTALVTSGHQPTSTVFESYDQQGYLCGLILVCLPSCLQVCRNHFAQVFLLLM